jgi:hypothetical protein
MYNGYHSPTDFQDLPIEPMELIAYFNTDGNYEMRLNHFIASDELGNKFYKYAIAKKIEILVPTINIGDTVVVMYKSELRRAVINSMSDAEVTIAVVDATQTLWLADYKINQCFKIQDGKKSRCEFIKDSSNAN